MKYQLWAFLALTASVGAQQPLPRQMLDAHNRLRALVGTPPLIWSEDLASYAQEWADRLLKRRQFSHRPHRVYGENLYTIAGATATPRQVVRSWAAESANYDYNSDTCRGVCGHYTQII
ncbi:MAG: CAP domain-containing protein, partial [Bryobacteraceae bacterium]